MWYPLYGCLTGPMIRNNKLKAQDSFSHKHFSARASDRKVLARTRSFIYAYPHADRRNVLMRRGKRMEDDMERYVENMKYALDK